MPSPRHLLVTLFIAFLVTFGLAAVVAPRNGIPCVDKQLQDKLLLAEGQLGGGETIETDGRSFSDLVNSVSPSSLHRILNTYFPGRYKQGVFESTHHAMEAVHADNAPLATTLVKLARRQQSNSTDTPSQTSEPTSDPIDTGSPSDTSNGVNSTPTPEPTPTPSPTSDPPGSTSNPPNTSTPAPNPPASSTQSLTPPVTTQRSGTTTPISPTTARRTSSPVTTVITSTKPNGEVTFLTTTTFVEVDAEPTETGSGSLQTNAAMAVEDRIVAFPALAGAILGGLFLI